MGFDPCDDGLPMAMAMLCLDGGGGGAWVSCTIVRMALWHPPASPEVSCYSYIS
ncbi:hypothetical protein TIFTF001_026115 [Ficus carica]|uniref:Uncharacterized protein n=1 Tax=Ficus carica TaxID=3494 RepID=A0AA88DHH7_FICCA|nr:hypothetical protein TIFTF001_026115 [Ficus carica]